MFVPYPLGLDSFVEVRVTDENNGEIRLANSVFERLVYDLTGQNPVGAEETDVVAVFQPNLDSALEQVGARDGPLPILFEETQVDTQIGPLVGARILLLHRVGVDHLLTGGVAVRLVLRVLGDVLGDGVGAGEVEVRPPPAVENDGDRAARVLVEADLELAQVLAGVVAGDSAQGGLDSGSAVVVEQGADGARGLRVALGEVVEAVEDPADRAGGEGALGDGRGVGHHWYPPLSSMRRIIRPMNPSTKWLRW